MAQIVKHLSTMRETRVRALGWEDPLEKEMATTPVLLPGQSHGLRSVAGYSPWGLKESDTTERLHFLSFFFFSFSSRLWKASWQVNVYHFPALKTSLRH